MKSLTSHSVPPWRKLSVFAIVLFATALYLYLFPSPTLTYIAIVLLHSFLGLIAALFLIPKLRYIFSGRGIRENAGWLLISLGAATGIVLLDAHGNPINKRNAWASRAVVYVRLIPPGAADTVHYRLTIPRSSTGKIKLHARLCYRKFSWYNTQFSHSGIPLPEMPQPQPMPDFDDRKFAFTGDTSRVSGQMKHVPDLPIIMISEDEVSLNIWPAHAPAIKPAVDLHPDDWTRWNDYGIGLLLQGDLKGAQQAFEQITKIVPQNPDGWVNLGVWPFRKGGWTVRGRCWKRPWSLAPAWPAHYFFARVLRAEGKYAEAADHLHTVLAQYPRDRVVCNDLGRIYFLQRKYIDAIGELQQVLSIDPEDLQAHYNLMLCYQGLGRAEKAQQEQKLYLRFKADESAQSLTGLYRRLHAEDNNERQVIHKHESVPLL